MKSVEKAVLKYLKTREEDWKWVMGGKVYTKQETITLFMKDKNFRQMICEEVVKLATHLFITAAEKKEK